MSNKTSELYVFYDGLCRLCSTEINHYKKRDLACRISFVDITEPSFQAHKEGLSPQKIHRHLHAKGADGEVFVGVEAFIEIWKLLPGYGWLASLAGRYPMKHILKAAYEGFVRIRPYLPKKANSCSDSPYCEIKGKQP